MSFLFAQSWAPFYYKIHRAALSTGLAKCGVAHPSEATLPSGIPVDSCPPIVWTVVELFAMPGKPKGMGAMLGHDLRFKPIQLKPWRCLPGGFGGALLKESHHTMLDKDRGIREDSCSSCSKEVVILCPARRSTHILPATAQQRPTRRWLEKEQCASLNPV